MNRKQNKTKSRPNRKCIDWTHVKKTKPACWRFAYKHPCNKASSQTDDAFTKSANWMGTNTKQGQVPLFMALLEHSRNMCFMNNWRATKMINRQTKVTDRFLNCKLCIRKKNPEVGDTFEYKSNMRDCLNGGKGCQTSESSLMSKQILSSCRMCWLFHL